MKKTVSFLAVLFLLLCLLPTGCGSEEEGKGITYDNTPLNLSADALDKIGSHLEDMEKVAEDGQLAFYMNMTSGEFCVQNLADGKCWYSNPVDWTGDGLASSSTKEQMGSQIILECYDESNHRKTLTSYTDCFRKGQLYITKIDDGVRVDYLLGTLVVQEYCPRIVRAEIFEQVLATLNEDDADTLSMRYRHITSASSEKTIQALEEEYKNIRDFPDVYVIRSLGNDIKKEIGRQFGQIGWTTEDTAAEHAMFGYESKQTDSGCFLIPVEYRLRDHAFTAEILSDEIQVQDGFYLSAVELLPYFAAGSVEDEGYILLPDGCGALLALNDTTRYGYAYQQPIYGRDAALVQTLDTQTYAQIYLPVYGISTAEGSVLAIVESGEADGKIRANLSGEISSYNTVWSVFEPTTKDFMQYDNLMNVDGAYVFTKARVQQHYTVRYCFLGAGSGYSEMAAAYRARLIARGLLTERPVQNGFYLDLVGGVDKRETLLGIPYTTHQALTTFAQAQEILQQLTDHGIQNISVRYTGWANNGLNNGLYDDAAPLSCLGGRKGLQQLLAYAGDNGIPLYMDAELSYMRHTGLFDGFSAGSDGVRTVTKKVATRAVVRKSTGELTGEVCYPLRTATQQACLTSFLRDYSRYDNPALSLASLGQTLYGDYRRSDTVHRSQALEALQAMLQEQVADRYDLVLDGGNAFLLGYAAGLLNVPEAASGLLMEKDSVPFYQMVVSGCLFYAGEALNLSGDWQTALLDAAQTGAGLHFTWMYADNSVLYQTNQTDLYALHYAIWLDQTLQTVQRYQQDMKDIAGKRILSHQTVQPGVYRTVFDGGKAVLVNYTAQAVSVGGVTVPAKSYQVGEAY